MGRRALLAAALGAGTAAALGGAAGPAAAADTAAGGGCHGKRRIPPGGIGMHLYTMRRPLATDFAGTLRQLSDIGYATVGVSGRHGHSAREIRGMIDDAGLEAVLEHVGYGTVAGSGLPQAIEDVHTLGGKWVVVPSLPGGMHSPAGFREAARALNEAGRACRDAGLQQVLFHNHGGDHDTVDGEVLFDILVNETDPHLVGFEFDLYWAVRGGADPLTYFRRHPGRFPALHVKDMAPNGDFADVGSGVLDFAEMFQGAKSGGVRQWLVEHDNPSDPFATARNSYEHLEALRY
ncbi:sugar phosphate isomerase/epimerase family protein [Streptomyces sp. MAR4 CNX-425]|uniref:sugar phosphate isomerase/epimerase family protein n=1 Tax=Streptomyces sp. MAR4 CNX-425 TaxID=3406343 RepID=UPI003B506BC4